MIHLELYSPPICPRDQNPKSIGRFEPSPWSPLVGAPFQGFAFLGTPKIRHIPFLDSPSSGLSTGIFKKKHLQQIPDFHWILLAGDHIINHPWPAWELGGIGLKLYQNHPQLEVYIPLYTQFYHYWGYHFAVADMAHSYLMYLIWHYIWLAHQYVSGAYSVLLSVPEGVWFVWDVPNVVKIIKVWMV